MLNCRLRFPVISFALLLAACGSPSGAPPPVVATVPGAPTGAAAVAGDAQVTVGWTTPASTGGSAITGYTVTASPGSATASTTGATTATVTGLTNGTAYTFTVVATNAVGSGAASAPSNIVTPSALEPPSLVLAPTTLSFTGTAGGAAPAAQSIAVTNAGGGALAAPTVSVTYATGTDWISTTVTGSSAPFAIAVGANTGALTAGSYAATLSVASAGAANSPQSVSVSFTVSAATAVPSLVLAPTTLSFTGTAGGATPAAQSIAVTNAGGGALAAPTVSVTYATGTDWISTTVTGSSAPFAIAVGANQGALTAGSYAATLSVASAGAANSPQSVSVSFMVSTNFAWANWHVPAQPPSNYTSGSGAASGTVTDTVTGLVWQQPAASATYAWPAAITYCQDLSLGGVSAGGWRLPTRIELLSIVDSTQSNPAMNRVFFPGTPMNWFWSSSPYASNTGSAWLVTSYDGSTAYLGGSYAYQVRCVR